MVGRRGGTLSGLRGQVRSAAAWHAVVAAPAASVPLVRTMDPTAELAKAEMIARKVRRLPTRDAPG